MLFTKKGKVENISTFVSKFIIKEWINVIRGFWEAFPL